MPRHLLHSCFAALLLISCTPKENLSFDRLDTALYDAVIMNDTLPAASLLTDSAYMAHFTTQVLDLTSPHMLSLYYANEPLRRLYADCLQEFANLDAEQQLLNEAAHRWKKLFPSTPLPRMVTCVSGWKQKVVITPQWATVSTDYYLGENYLPYQQYFYDYDRVTMQRDYLVRDLFDALLHPQLSPFAMTEHTLLAQMIEEGRRLWLLHQLLPSIPQEVLFGFTKKQLKWCSSHERKMWNTLISDNALYETDPSILRYYLTAGSSTSTLPEESPARAVVWIGYQIIDRYLRNSSGRAIDRLCTPLQAQELLRQSEYL